MTSAGCEFRYAAHAVLSAEVSLIMTTRRTLNQRWLFSCLTKRAGATLNAVQDTAVQRLRYLILLAPRQFRAGWNIADESICP